MFRMAWRDDLKVKGKPTKEDLNDVRETVRSKMYWPKLLLKNWYGLAVLGILTWATILGLIGKAKLNWEGIGLVWAVIVALFSWSFYRARTETVREFEQLNARLPDWITVADKGVTLSGPDGATGFLPWNHFSGWREGRRVLLLDRTQECGFVILPIGELSESERQGLRELLGRIWPSKNQGR